MTDNHDIERIALYGLMFAMALYFIRVNRFDLCF